MNQLDIPSTITISVSQEQLKPAARLIVLLPDAEADPALLAGKLQAAAKAFESRVQLIGLCSEAAREAGIRRRLVTLKAMLEDPQLFVEWKIEKGANWLNVARLYWREGDVIVCFTDRSRKSPRPALEAKLNAVIYVIDGVFIDPAPRPAWQTNALAWAGSLSLIVGFFLFQARLFQAPQGLPQNLMFYFSLLVEGGSIWIWNTIFS